MKIILSKKNLFHIYFLIHTSGNVAKINIIKSLKIKYNLRKYFNKKILYNLNILKTNFVDISHYIVDFFVKHFKSRLQTYELKFPNQRTNSRIQHPN